MKTARALKNKAAAGLGSLAYALSTGDRSVLKGNAEDRPIRIVANAIERPDDFYEWAIKQQRGPAVTMLVKNGARFGNMGQPVEKACAKAAVYLAIEEGCPKVSFDAIKQGDFPYWTVFDQHTREGNRVLHDIARDLHIPLNLLEWTFFYYEGGVAEGERPSKWWRRMCRWRFRKAGLSPDESFLVWEPVKRQLMEALAEDAHILHKDIYRWKMAHLERVREIREKVERYIANFSDIHKGQMSLF